jgi:cysteine desulfurase/selenocysteine lyase
MYDHSDSFSNPFFAEEIRGDFPILHEKVYGKPLVYLDNAATTQKPQSVIDAVANFYSMGNSNVHRGVHALSVRATEAYEAVREKVRQFIKAGEAREIIFVRGTTEGINLVAESYGGAHVGMGDDVLITALEHHSNIVPWQRLCRSTGANLVVAPIDERGEVIMDQYKALFSPRTKLAAVTYVSNAIGTVTPIKEMIAAAHEHGVPVLVDGAQAAPHFRIDVQDLDCEFFAFSGHKTYGPTGIGALYVKSSILENMAPYQSGGDMIASVTFEKTTYNAPPHRFEAGTPNVAGTVGLGAALDYLSDLGWDAIAAHENDLLGYACEVIANVPKVRLVGAPRRRAGSISFNVEGIHPHDAGMILDREGIAVRAGHHCSQPVMDFFGIPATLRASFGLYNTRTEIESLAAGLQKVFEVFD